MKRSKSEEIRQLLKDKPGLQPKAIQAELEGRGIKVTRTLCKVERHRFRREQSEECYSGRSAKLRMNKRQINRRIVRLTDDDFAIWQTVTAFVESLDDPATELHDCGARLVLQIPEVRNWTSAVSSRNGKERRQAILEQFINDLRRIYPKPPIEPPKRSFDWEFSPLAPNYPYDYDQEEYFRNHRAAKNQAQAIERQQIWEYVSAATDRHDNVLEIFDDPEIVEYLLSISPWHRYEALKAIGNSYPVKSSLNSLLELAWDRSKLADLPEKLNDLLKFNQEKSAGELNSIPEMSQLLFLLSLWISGRIAISQPDGTGLRRLMVGHL